MRFKIFFPLLGLEFEIIVLSSSFDKTCRPEDLVLEMCKALSCMFGQYSTCSYCFPIVPPRRKHNRGHFGDCQSYIRRADMYVQSNTGSNHRCKTGCSGHRFSVALIREVSRKGFKQKVSPRWTSDCPHSTFVSDNLSSRFFRFGLKYRSNNLWIDKRPENELLQWTELTTKSAEEMNNGDRLQHNKIHLSASLLLSKKNLRTIPSLRFPLLMN